MMKIKLFGIFYLFLILCSISCSNPDLTASYISVKPEDITVDVGETDGTSAHGFSDVWVYVNSTKLGSWELPSKVPVLDSDVSDITLYPGIRMNGMASTRPMYPFVQPYKTKINLKKDKISDIKPVFKYYSGVRFPLVENFEDAGLVFEDGDESQAPLQRTSDPNLIYRDPYNPDFVNHNSGVITLADTATYFEIISLAMQLPASSNSVFLELNYKCQADLKVELLATRSTGILVSTPLVTVRKSSEWKKIYINLTQVVSNILNYNASDFRVIFSGNRDEGADPVSFYFDNIQVLYLVTQ